MYACGNQWTTRKSMSLDFVLIKSHGQPLELEDIDEDLGFKLGDYKQLADRLFSPVTWSGEMGIATRADMTFELTPSDVSLSVTARGTGDTVGFMGDVATVASKEGIVTVDVQGSEILQPLDS